ncbi:energy transducer TonB [Spirosoma arboris]
MKVLKGVSPEIDAEAIRLVASMPNWVPGKVDGQAVDCFYNLPINFSVR